MLLLILIGVALSIRSEAQELVPKRQVISQAGGSYHASGFFIQQSIGQVGPIGTTSTSSLRLQQGFIQSSSGIASFRIEEMLYLDLFPNPFDEHLTIAFQQKLESEIHVRIHSLEGQSVFEQSYSATQSLKLTLSELAVGLYVIHITSGSRAFSGRILKLEL